MTDGNVSTNGPDNQKLESPTLLIVDDDPALRDRLARAFGKRGFEVTVAGGRTEAGAAAKKDSPEFAIVDLVGPGAVARLPVDGSVLIRRADGEVIIGHQPGQIGVAGVELENDHVVALVTVHGTKDGRSVSERIVHVIHASQGRLTEFRGFPESSPGFDDFWK